VSTLTLDEESYPPVRLQRVYLVRASFEDEGAVFRPNARDYIVDLSVNRRSELELSVELAVALTAATAGETPLRVSACYGADFVLAEDLLPAERDEVLRQTAYELAPAVLYSYVRQVFDDLTGRGRAERITLPFMPIPLELEEDEMQIPAPPPQS
jgi:preprotein translocase subunit SecB